MRAFKGLDGQPQDRSPDFSLRINDLRQAGGVKLLYKEEEREGGEGGDG